MRCTAVLVPIVLLAIGAAGLPSGIPSFTDHPAEASVSSSVFRSLPGSLTGSLAASPSSSPETPAPAPLAAGTPARRIDLGLPAARGATPDLERVLPEPTPPPSPVPSTATATATVAAPVPAAPPAAASTPQARVPAPADVTTTPAPARGSSTTPPSLAASTGPTSATQAAALVLALVNQQRAAAGCPGLAGDAPLAAITLAHSADMRDRHFFAHVNPDGLSPFDRAQRAGIGYARAENIAAGQATPAAVMASWMASPGHRANILNCGLTRLGMGVAYGSGGPWWTQEFGG